MRTPLLLIAAILALALPAGAQGQETCPTGDDWVKVDGLSGLSFTYSPPAGFSVGDSCYKASTTVVYGSGATVSSAVENQNGKLQELSHASFRLVPVEDPEEPEVEDPETPVVEDPDGPIEVIGGDIEAPAGPADPAAIPLEVVETPVAPEPVVLEELPFTGPRENLALVALAAIALIAAGRAVILAAD